MVTPDQARRAAEHHADDLAAHPDVVGVGTRPVDGTGDAGHAVAVYVSRGLPAGQLPEAVDVETSDGTVHVPVVVVEIGPVTPEADDPFSPQ